VGTSTLEGPATPTPTKPRSLAMTRIYQGLGLSFLYPENWNITEDTDDGKLVGFTLESPSSAFLTVTEYPWTVTPADALDQSYQILRSEYDDVEFEEIPPPINAEQHSLSECIAGDVRFYYLDLMVISRLIAFVMNQRTYLVQIQAEDRDFDKLEMVFQAILISIFQSAHKDA
jgi:hypothetical protein